MSERRQVWQTLSELLTRLERDISAPLDAATPTAVQALAQEVRKLGREQFRSNMLAQRRTDQWDQAVDAIRSSQGRNAELLEEVCAQRVSAARHELLQAVIPALDGLEAAIASGQAYLRERDEADVAVARTPGLSPAGASLAPFADRAALAAWLDGLRLVRERLLAVLEAGGVMPIPTVGHHFDPYLHVAVATTSEGDGQPGVVVAQERPGYRSSDGIIRYAEVVVYRPEATKTERPEGE